MGTCREGWPGRYSVFKQSMQFPSLATRRPGPNHCHLLVTLTSSPSQLTGSLSSVLFNPNRNDRVEVTIAIGVLNI